MADKKCRYCAMFIPKEAKICPHCRKRQGMSLLLKIILIIFGIALLPYIYESYENQQKALNAYKSTGNNSSISQPYEKRYAYKTINIRSGAGKTSDIVGKLQRGDVVKIVPFSDKEGWIIVYDEYNNKKGYVWKELLETQPIPPFEIVSWNWYKDPSFGGDGAVIYNVEVRNNTNKYVRSLKVEFTTHDSEGNIIDSEYTYVNGLSPGGTASDKSYATYFGREAKATIRIVP